VGNTAAATENSNLDMSTSSQGDEMWYYTQHERNAGVMRPMQQLEPRPPVPAFAAAGMHCFHAFCL
jgi:hypothetical protein